MTTDTARPAIGQGVYTFPEAAGIVRRRHRYSAGRLRSWCRTHQTFGHHDTAEGDRFLTFSDLVSLEVVARLRERSMSGQRVRAAEAKLRREFPEIVHPFAAVGIFYTDGKNLWAALDRDGENVVEVIGRRPRHMVLRDVVRPFVDEIHVGPDERMATRWDLSPFVEIDPTVQFGRPVVRGTRVPIKTVMSNLDVASPTEVADWYGLTIEQVEGARSFAAA